MASCDISHFSTAKCSRLLFGVLFECRAVYRNFAKGDEFGYGGGVEANVRLRNVRGRE